MRQQKVSKRQKGERVSFPNGKVKNFWTRGLSKQNFFLEAREFVSTSSLVLRASDSSEDLSDLVSRRSTCSSSRA